MYGCFYLFSAFTLTLSGFLLLLYIIWVADIRGLMHDIILWIYIIFVVTYSSVKIIIWIYKFYTRCKKIFMG